MKAYSASFLCIREEAFRILVPYSLSLSLFSMPLDGTKLSPGFLPVYWYLIRISFSPPPSQHHTKGITALFPKSDVGNIS
jgi:hypothetical protein